MRGAMKEITCKCCANKKMVRVADFNRGWGLFCSKSCKAYWQEHRRKRPSPYVKLEMVRSEVDSPRCIADWFADDHDDIDYDDGWCESSYDDKD